METAAGTHTFEVLGTRFTIDKKYVPTKALGKGAYGVVCACRNAETGSKVAIKRISPMAASRVDGLHVLREIRLMRWLGKHPNIITLKDLMVNVEGDELYLVMELYDADMHRIISSPQPLGDAHYKHFLYQLLRGLRFAHVYGVIHRDLKPANLLLTRNCDLVISDFGLARQMPEGAAHPMTEHVVTRWYRAPELMLSADGYYTVAVDMWSIGCIFAELLGRTPLFAGKDFMEVIRMQINVLGTRPKEELAYIRSDQALVFLGELPLCPRVPWESLFPDASGGALDLLDKMLQFHPSKRITVDEALAHSYFDSVRSQYTDPEPVLPLGPGGFHFEFENDPTLDATAFRRLIIEEAASLRAERGMHRALRALKHSHSTASSGGSTGSTTPSSASAGATAVASMPGDDGIEMRTGAAAPPATAAPFPAAAATGPFPSGSLGGAPGAVGAAAVATMVPAAAVVMAPMAGALGNTASGPLACGAAVTAVTAAAQAGPGMADTGMAGHAPTATEADAVLTHQQHLQIMQLQQQQHLAAMQQAQAAMAAARGATGAAAASVQADGDEVMVAGGYHHKMTPSVLQQQQAQLAEAAAADPFATAAVAAATATSAGGLTAAGGGGDWNGGRVMPVYAAASTAMGSGMGSGMLSSVSGIGGGSSGGLSSGVGTLGMGALGVASAGASCSSSAVHPAVHYMPPQVAAAGSNVAPQQPLAAAGSTATPGTVRYVGAGTPGGLAPGVPQAPTGISRAVPGLGGGMASGGGLTQGIRGHGIGTRSSYAMAASAVPVAAAAGTAGGGTSGDYAAAGPTTSVNVMRKGRLLPPAPQARASIPAGISAGAPVGMSSGLGAVVTGAGLGGRPAHPLPPLPQQQTTSRHAQTQ